MIKRVGFLTSGGDCQGLNASMRGVAKALYEHYGDKNLEIIGILSRGGTILGTSRQPFKMMRVIEEDGIDKVACMKKTYRYLKLKTNIRIRHNLIMDRSFFATSM